MKCQKCGKEVPENVKFCPSCGAEIGNTEPLSSDQRYIYGSHPYHKLGGFLKVIVVFCYIGVVISLLRIISEISTYGNTKHMMLIMGYSFTGGVHACALISMIGAILIHIVSAVILYSFAKMIVSKDSAFLGFIQRASLTLIIVLAVFNLLMLLWQNSIVGGRMVGAAGIAGYIVGSVLLWVIGMLVWTIYFARSVRVRTYMGSDDYLRKSLFNKNTASPIPADGSDKHPYTANPSSQPFDPQTQWKCPECGKINAKYVGTCGCGHRNDR